MDVKYAIYEKPKTSKCWTAHHKTGVSGSSFFPSSSNKSSIIEECEILKATFPHQDYVVVEIKPLEHEGVL